MLPTDYCKYEVKKTVHSLVVGLKEHQKCDLTDLNLRILIDF